MERQSRDIYNNLYREYGNELDRAQAELAQEIRVRLDNAIDALYLSERIRPDARLYLLVNFHRMAIMPLTEARKAYTDELYNFVSEDAEIILRRASDLADRRSEAEISAHLLIDSVSEVWDELRLNSQDWW